MEPVRPAWGNGPHEAASSVSVCIDGDGIAPHYLDAIVAEARTLGSLLVPRVFGNWENPALRGWQRALIPNRLEQRHHAALTPGKNATDIALVIDVLELTYLHGIRRFCLALADSDYTPLITQLQRLGCQVLCVGPANTARSIQTACHRFVVLEQEGVEVVGNKDCSALREQILGMYDALAKGKRVWISLQQVEDQLKGADAAFCARDYGHRNVGKLVKARLASVFEVRSRPSQPTIQELRRKG